MLDFKNLKDEPDETPVCESTVRLEIYRNMLHPVKQSQKRDEGGNEGCKSLFLHCLENREGLHRAIRTGALSVRGSSGRVWNDYRDLFLQR